MCTRWSSLATRTKARLRVANGPLSVSSLGPPPPWKLGGVGGPPRWMKARFPFWTDGPGWPSFVLSTNPDSLSPSAGSRHDSCLCVPQHGFCSWSFSCLSVPAFQPGFVGRQDWPAWLAMIPAHLLLKLPRNTCNAGQAGRLIGVGGKPRDSLY